MRAETAFRIGLWRVDPLLNRITGPDGSVDLEPQVMDLLVLLAEAEGEVRSKDEIAARLWPDASVNEDALSRTVWKLRQALGDDARVPLYVQTVSRRGYRLLEAIMPVASPARRRLAPFRLPVLLAGAGLVVGLLVIGGLLMERSQPVDLPASPTGDFSAQLSRADGFYAQYTRADNEAALRLYERVIADDPDSAAALAGQANALTQRVIRWGLDGAAARTTLTDALLSGEMERLRARAALARAEALAHEATRLDPGHARAWRALGLVKAAQSDFAAARRAYDRALVINPEDWGSMINLSEIDALTGHPERQTDLLSRSFEAMTREYSVDPVAIRPWHSEVGLLVARLKAEAGEPQQAELWYRRVLALDPLNRDAVTGLAALLRASGDERGAEALCRELEVVSEPGCADSDHAPRR